MAFRPVSSARKWLAQIRENPVDFISRNVIYTRSCGKVFFLISREEIVLARTSPHGGISTNPVPGFPPSHTRPGTGTFRKSIIMGEKKHALAHKMPSAHIVVDGAGLVRLRPESG